MAQLRVTLSIGYRSQHEEILELDEDELEACSTDDERQELYDKYWSDWAWNYIDGGATLVEESNED